MEIENKIDLFAVPIQALKAPTKQIITNGLNKKKVILSEDNLPRDWQGLAHLTGLSTNVAGDNPAGRILMSWEADPASSLGLLEQYLGKLDRWDIVDDVYHLIREDAKDFVKRMSETSNNQGEESEIENKALTQDDIGRLRHGLDLMMYDALLLYADEDRDFACEMAKRLEDGGCKICLKDHFLGGLSFEHQGIMKLISERCRRVIVIVSQNFINSNANRFFVLFAQATSIERNVPIIIPCIYGEGPINMPIEIKHITKLDYNRVKQLRDYDFWGHLRSSITLPTRPAICAPPGLSSLAIQEVMSCSNVDQLSRSNVNHFSRSNVNHSTQDTVLAAISEHKRSKSLSSLLSISTNTSNESNKSEKKNKIKSTTGTIIRKLFKSKKSKQQKIAVPVG